MNITYYHAINDLGGLWRRPYGILITGIWTSLAEKVADMAEKLA